MVATLGEGKTKEAEGSVTSEVPAPIPTVAVGGSYRGNI